LKKKKKKTESDTQFQRPFEFSYGFPDELQDKLKNMNISIPFDSIQTLWKKLLFYFLFLFPFLLQTSKQKY